MIKSRDGWKLTNPVFWLKNLAGNETGSRSVLMELAHEYAEICTAPENDRNRDLWRRHNNFEKTDIPILCDWNVISEAHPLAGQCICKNPALWYLEFMLRNRIFHATVGDDHIFEPWLTIPAMYRYTPVKYDQTKGRYWFSEGGLWGPKSNLTEHYADDGRDDPNVPKSEVIKYFSNWHSTKSIKTEPSVKALADIGELRFAHHKIDRAATEMVRQYVSYMFGGYLDVNMDTRPMYLFPWFGSDLSTSLGKMMGLENLMANMYDDPGLIHAFCRFMQHAILTVFDEAEKAGDWYPGDEIYTNVGMPYGAGVAEPTMKKGYQMKDLWYFTHAQEFTMVSSEMHNEFIFQYQLPIMEKFGACSYGCCEDLTRKIDMLRQCKTLKKISVTPSANVKKCAEQIGRNYLFSWKPNPAYICADFDEEATRRYIRQGLKDSMGCQVDIMLKDVTTLQGDMSRPRRWTEIVRGECARAGG